MTSSYYICIKAMGKHCLYLAKVVVVKMLSINLLLLVLLVQM